MNSINRDKQLYAGEVDVIRRGDDCTIYRINNSYGNAIITRYSVFPGIELIHNDVNTQWISVDEEQPKNIFQINYCKEGIVECKTIKEGYLYISKGNLVINQKYNIKNDYKFPLKYFYGITVNVNLDEAPKCLSCILEEVSVNLLELKNKFCKNDKRFLVIKEDESIEHIFLELYSVSEKIRKGYHKVKILELFLFLSSFGQKKLKESKNYYSKRYIDVIKEIKEHLTIHLSEKITLDELSVRFKIPLTTMKFVFKEIYGDSIYSFIKSYKMQKAAELLKYTNEGINEISGSLGYDNASKFSEAFKKVIGVNPSVYRKNVKMEQ